MSSRSNIPQTFLDSLSQKDIAIILSAAGGVALGALVAGLIVGRKGKKAEAPVEAKDSIKERSTTSSGSLSGSAVYESSAALNEYFLFHYAEEQDYMPYHFGPKNALAFAQRCGKICLMNAQKYAAGMDRALDIGCAVGGSSFELARGFKEVIGIDFSHNFVQGADYLKKHGSIEVVRTVQSDIKTSLKVNVDPSIDRTRASFRQGDACNLPVQELGKFSCVLAANLICRLPDPIRFYDDLKQLVREGGILVILSPYSFLEEYTPKERWTGGYRDTDGAPVWAQQTLAKRLEPEFKFVAESDEPFLIREHERKYQYGVSHCTVWRRT